MSFVSIYNQDSHIVAHFALGMNEDAQCGTGNELKLLTPTQIEFENKDNELYVVDVSCGHSHTGEIRHGFRLLRSSTSLTRTSSLLQYAFCQNTLHCSG